MAAVAAACMARVGVALVRVVVGVAPVCMVMAHVEVVAVVVCMSMQQVLQQHVLRQWVLQWRIEAPLAHMQSRRWCRQSGACGARNLAGRGWCDQGRGDWVGTLSLLCPWLARRGGVSRFILH